MTATIEYVRGKETKMGKYQPTTLDAQKAKADILVTAIDDKYTIKVQNPKINLTGRGVTPSKWIGNIYYVTERIYKQLCTKYNVMCDF